MTNFEYIRAQVVERVKKFEEELAKLKNYDDLYDTFEGFCDKETISRISKIDVCKYCNSDECRECHKDNKWFNEPYKK